MHHVLGIDPGYSVKRPTTGFAVVALEDGGRIAAVVERGHCTAAGLYDLLPRLLDRFAPRLAAIDAPLMDILTETSPFGATKCRPQEMVTMQTAFSACRLKAGHAFTPRGLEASVFPPLPWNSPLDRHDAPAQGTCLMNIRPHDSSRSRFARTRIRGRCDYVIADAITWATIQSSPRPCGPPTSDL